MQSFSIYCFNAPVLGVKLPSLTVFDLLNFFEDEEEDNQQTVLSPLSAYQASTSTAHKLQAATIISSRGQWQLSSAERSPNNAGNVFLHDSMYLHSPSSKGDAWRSSYCKQPTDVEPAHKPHALRGDASQDKQVPVPKQWKTFKLMTASKAIIFFVFRKIQTVSASSAHWL